MYTYKLKFYPLEIDNEFCEKVEMAFGLYMRNLVTNGQVIVYSPNTIKYSDHYVSFIIIPEINSLDTKNDGKFVKMTRERFRELLKKDIEIEYIGKNIDIYPGCSCLNSTYYILDGELGLLGSPIRCGDCDKKVPLYKFQKTYNNEEYYDIICWQSLYEAFDTQFTQGIGERYAYKKLNSLKSELTIEGRRICKLLEDKTGKPFYYYVFKYYRKNKKECPNCGKDWINKSEDYKYDYVCHECRLVSNDVWSS